MPRLGSFRPPAVGPSSLLFAQTRPAPSPLQLEHLQLRFRSELAPKRVKYRKAFKGDVPVRIGGSLKGTTLEIGDYGLRVKAPCRLSAKILKGCETAIKKGIKSVKEAECFMRVFPSIPVCVKGNETRMGKGKGSFEYWACRCVVGSCYAFALQANAALTLPLYRAPVGRILFEVGGGGIQREVAFAALRLAQPKIPVVTELIDRSAQARLGGMLLDRPGKEPQVIVDNSEDEAAEGMLEAIRAMRVEDEQAAAPAPPPNAQAANSPAAAS